MAISENWNGYVAIKKQSAKGTQANGADGLILWNSGGQGGKLSKAAIESGIIRHDAQQLRGRHGSLATSGSYSSELGIGRADPVLAAIMRNNWAAPLTNTQTINVAIGTGPSRLVAPAGDWITKGLRVGDVIRPSGLSNAANNGRNLTITALTATTITVAETLVETTGAEMAFSIVRPGRKLINSAAGGLLKSYFTVEEYEYDLDASELFTDCVWSRFTLRMQPDGNLETEMAWTGTGRAETVTGGAAPHFTAPSDPTALSLVATEASIMLNGSTVVDLTAFDLTIDLQASAPKVINATGISPDVFLGTFRPALNLTILRSDLQALADFKAETQLSLHLMATENESEPKDFFSLYLGNFTLGDVAKSAMQKGGGARTVTLQVPAELVGKDTRGGAFDATTMKIQVSNAS